MLVSDPLQDFNLAVDPQLNIAKHSIESPSYPTRKSETGQDDALICFEWGHMNICRDVFPHVNGRGHKALSARRTVFIVARGQTPAIR